MQNRSLHFLCILEILQVDNDRPEYSLTPAPGVLNRVYFTTVAGCLNQCNLKLVRLGSDLVVQMAPKIVPV